jgi:hypothetical protein
MLGDGGEGMNDRLARLRKVRGKYKDTPPYHDETMPDDDQSHYVAILDMAAYHLQPTHPRLADDLAKLRDVLNRPGTIVVQGEEA